MNTLTQAARLARRELRGGLRGFRIFLACVILGIVAIAAIGTVRESITAGLAEKGAALLGGDAEIELTYRFATEAERDWLSTNTQDLSEIVDFRSLAVSAVGERGLTQVKAVDAMIELFNNMPQSEKQFNEAKDAALKQIAAQRITKSSIFWNYESLKKRGIDYDNREEMYEQIKKMTMGDVNSFFNENVKGKDYSISVIGNKNDLDLKALTKLGQVHEMDVDYLFNYKEVEVKQ